MDNLEWFRQFYLVYPQLLLAGKADAVRRISQDAAISDAVRRKSHALRGESEEISHAVHAEFNTGYAPRSQSWRPGRLNPNLSWMHYRTLLRVEKPEARAFYEIEALQNNWSARELERQINSLLYERLALSRDKKGLLRLARKGQVVRYTLGPEKEKKIFASRYKLLLSSEAELKAEWLRELKSIGPAAAARPDQAKKKAKP